VLCEKPLCVNAQQGERLVAAAQASDSFLMEAMWMRFLPAVEQAMAWVREGAIGEPRLLSCDFGFRCGWNPESRLLDPQLAGGGLLDVGVYTVAMASLLFGHEPVGISAQAHLGASGVDEQCALLLRYGGGELALLAAAVQTNTPHLARIDGSAGRITIPAFWHATSATLHRNGQEPETVERPFDANGYEYEAAEVGRCLRQGLRESPRMTHVESLGILRIMDQARAQIGLVYPFEPQSQPAAAPQELAR
jgi:dihydrodiol dehydrogenase / D-xylose 1-dehydrogenase (NADP)